MCSIFFNSVWVVWAYLLISMLYVDKTCSMYCSEYRPLLPVGPSVESNIVSDQRRPSEVRIFKSWFECNEAKRKHSDWCCIYRPRLDNLFPVRSAIFRLMCYRKIPVQQPSLHDQVIFYIVKDSTQGTKIQTDQPFQSEKLEKKSVESDASSYISENEGKLIGLEWLFTRFSKGKHRMILWEEDISSIQTYEQSDANFDRHSNDRQLRLGLKYFGEAVFKISANKSFESLLTADQLSILDRSYILHMVVNLLKEYTAYIFVKKYRVLNEVCFFKDYYQHFFPNILTSDLSLLSDILSTENKIKIQQGAFLDFTSKLDLSIDRLAKDLNEHVLSIVRQIKNYERVSSFCVLPHIYVNFDRKKFSDCNLFEMKAYLLSLLNNIQISYEKVVDRLSKKVIKDCIAKIIETYTKKKELIKNLVKYNLMLCSQQLVDLQYNERAVFKELFDPLCNVPLLDDVEFYSELKKSVLSFNDADKDSFEDPISQSKAAYYSMKSDRFGSLKNFIAITLPKEGLDNESNKDNDEIIKIQLLNTRALIFTYPFKVYSRIGGTFLEMFWNNFVTKPDQIRYDLRGTMLHGPCLASFFYFLNNNIYGIKNRKSCRYDSFMNDFFSIFLSNSIKTVFEKTEAYPLEWLSDQPLAVKLLTYISLMEGGCGYLKRKFSAPLLYNFIGNYPQILNSDKTIDSMKKYLNDKLYWKDIQEGCKFYNDVENLFSKKFYFINNKDFSNKESFKHANLLILVYSKMLNFIKDNNIDLILPFESIECSINFIYEYFLKDRFLALLNQYKNKSCQYDMFFTFIRKNFYQELRDELRFKKVSELSNIKITDLTYDHVHLIYNMVKSLKRGKFTIYLDIAKDSNVGEDKTFTLEQKKRSFSMQALTEKKQNEKGEYSIAKFPRQGTKMDTDQPSQSDESKKKSVEQDASSYIQSDDGYYGLRWLINRYCTKAEPLSLFEKEPYKSFVNVLCGDSFNEEDLCVLCDGDKEVFLDTNLLIDTLCFLLKDYVNYVFFEKTISDVKMLLLKTEQSVSQNELRHTFDASLMMINAKRSFMKDTHLDSLTDMLKSLNPLILQVVQEVKACVRENSLCRPMADSLKQSNKANTELSFEVGKSEKKSSIQNKSSYYSQKVLFKKLFEPLSNNVSNKDGDFYLKLESFIIPLSLEHHGIVSISSDCLNPCYHDKNIWSLCSRLQERMQNDKTKQLVKKQLLEIRALLAAYTFYLEDKDFLKEYWDNCFMNKELKVEYEKGLHKVFLASYLDYLHTSLNPNDKEGCSYLICMNNFFYAYLNYKAKKLFKLEHVSVLEDLKKQPASVQLYVYIQWIKEKFKSIKQQFNIDYFNNLIKTYRHVIYNTEEYNNVIKGVREETEENYIKPDDIVVEPEQQKSVKSIFLSSEKDNNERVRLNEERFMILPSANIPTLLNSFAGKTGYVRDYVIVIMFFKILCFMDKMNIKYVWSPATSVKKNIIYLFDNYLKPFFISYFKQFIQDGYESFLYIYVMQSDKKAISLSELKKMVIDEKNYGTILFALDYMINLIESGAVSMNMHITFDKD